MKLALANSTDISLLLLGGGVIALIVWQYVSSRKIKAIHDVTLGRLNRLEIDNPAYGWNCLERLLSDWIPKFYSAISQKDMPALKGFSSDLCFDVQKEQLDQWQQNNLKYFSKVENVRCIKPVRYFQDAKGLEFLYVSFVCEWTSWLKENGSDKVVGGSNQARKDCKFVWCLLLDKERGWVVNTTLSGEAISIIVGLKE